MKILIVDDEDLARERLRHMLSGMDQKYTMLEANNGVEALEIATREMPEIILLDIRMPLMDGLECAFHIAKMDPAPPVIFITAYDEHAITAFEANAVDYLLKPVRTERLRRALEKAKSISHAVLRGIQQSPAGKKSRTHLSAVSQGKIRLIPVSEIRYFKADQKYITVYWRNNETLIDESLKMLEEEFGEIFLRIHRNAMISPAHVEALEKTPNGGYLIQLRGIRGKLAVSRRHTAEVKQRLKNFSD